MRAKEEARPNVAAWRLKSGRVLFVLGEGRAIPDVEELNIGYSIVARALAVGFRRAVQEMAAWAHRGRRE